MDSSASGASASCLGMEAHWIWPQHNGIPETVKSVGLRLWGTLFPQEHCSSRTATWVRREHRVTSCPSWQSRWQQRSLGCSTLCRQVWWAKRIGFWGPKAPGPVHDPCWSSWSPVRGPSSRRRHRLSSCVGPCLSPPWYPRPPDGCVASPARTQQRLASSTFILHTVPTLPPLSWARLRGLQLSTSSPRI